MSWAKQFERPPLPREGKPCSSSWVARSSSVLNLLKHRLAGRKCLAQRLLVNLANTGTLDGLTPTLTIVGSGAAALTNILKVNIQKCTVAWAAGSCSGTATDVLGSVGTPVLVSSVTGSALTNLNIT